MRCNSTLLKKIAVRKIERNKNLKIEKYRKIYVSPQWLPFANSRVVRTASHLPIYPPILLYEREKKSSFENGLFEISKRIGADLSIERIGFPYDRARRLCYFARCRSGVPLPRGRPEHGYSFRGSFERKIIGWWKFVAG